jgi:uncharacterized protein
MDERIEENLRLLVERTTQKAAIEEWKTVSEQQRVPLYNYRYDHIKEVVDLAKYLATDTKANMDVVILAAWLHDLSKPGIGGISAEHHGVASAELAERILPKEGIDTKTVALVCDTIKKHVGLTIKEPLEPIEAQIIWEADKLMKLGVIGVFQQLLNLVIIKPGQGLQDISNGLKEFLPLAEKIAACAVTVKGKAVAKERLKRVYIISEMLESELDPITTRRE